MSHVLDLQHSSKTQSRAKCLVLAALTCKCLTRGSSSSSTRDRPTPSSPFWARARRSGTRHQLAREASHSPRDSPTCKRSSAQTNLPSGACACMRDHVPAHLPGHKPPKLPRTDGASQLQGFGWAGASRASLFSALARFGLESFPRLASPARRPSNRISRTSARLPVYTQTHARPERPPQTPARCPLARVSIRHRTGVNPCVCQ